MKAGRDGLSQGTGTTIDFSGLTAAIVCADRNLVRVFEITGLDRSFEIRPTLDVAQPARPTRV